MHIKVNLLSKAAFEKSMFCGNIKVFVSIRSSTSATLLLKFQSNLSQHYVGCNVYIKNFFFILIVCSL